MADPVDNEAVLAERERHLADLGELAGPLTHEFNNVLNNLTLHLEILKQKAPEIAAADFDSLRRQVMHAAKQTALFQRYRRLSSGDDDTADLNTAVSQAADLLTKAPPDPLGRPPLVVRIAGPEKKTATNAVTISLELRDGLAAVRGKLNDLRRLCRFLLHNAVRAAAVRGGAVGARTIQQEGQALLVIEDGGPDIPEPDRARMFEPGRECREGMCCLELAACRSIVRRLNGTIEANARQQGGLTIVVSLTQ